MFARQFIANAQPEELMQLVDMVLPATVDAFDNEQLKQFIQLLFKKHLGVLLSKLDTQDRAQLLATLLPVIAKEFPLELLDLENAELEG